LGMSALTFRYGLEILSKNNQKLVLGRISTELEDKLIVDLMRRFNEKFSTTFLISSNASQNITSSENVVKTFFQQIEFDYNVDDEILQFLQVSIFPFHVDVSLLKDITNELDIEKFKNWRPEFKNSMYVKEIDGKYLTHREVEKMSKSKYNVVNPDDICNEYGADGLRLYEMFLGPLEQSKPWNTQGLSGVYGFLKKFWNLYFNGDTFEVSDEEPTKAEFKILHTLIKKVLFDIENFSFNTSVSSFMIAVNELQKLKCNKRAILEPLAIIISPYAPHICEEVWNLLGNNSSIEFEKFPILDEAYLVEDEIDYPVSFNGKMKFKIKLAADLEKEEVQKIILENEDAKRHLDGKKVKNFIFVPKKIINIVS